MQQSNELTLFPISAQLAGLAAENVRTSEIGPHPEGSLYIGKGGREGQSVEKGDRILYQCNVQELRYDSRAVGSTEERRICFGGLVMISREMTSEIPSPLNWMEGQGKDNKGE